MAQVWLLSKVNSFRSSSTNVGFVDSGDRILRQYFGISVQIACKKGCRSNRRWRMFHWHVFRKENDLLWPFGNVVRQTKNVIKLPVIKTNLVTLKLSPENTYAHVLDGKAAVIAAVSSAGQFAWHFPEVDKYRCFIIHSAIISCAAHWQMALPHCVAHYLTRGSA